jgi:hypothetical protein
VEQWETTTVGVRRVERIQHLEVFEGCHKECVQDSSLRLEAERKLRRYRTFEKSPQRITGSLFRGVFSMRCKFACGWTSFHREIPGSFRRNHQEGWTVRILGGEFTKSREPLDLMEKQVSYHEYFRRF